ncbi:MAG: transposase [Myxococcales bacterium]|nr:transposase [Myxococcales bacterium]
MVRVSDCLGVVATDSHPLRRPGEHTTGGKVVRTSTLKAGPRYLKAMLVQCAWSAWRTRPNDPMVLWARAIAERRGKRIAIVALARKLATVLWAVWRHDRPYDSSRAATRPPSSGEQAA